MRILSGSANEALARAVVDDLGQRLTEVHLSRFPDGEVEVMIDPDLRDETVYVLQPTSPPVDAHLVELLMLVDAIRRCGADRIVAVVPYLGYARQDRRTEPGQPIGIRVVGDLLGAAGIDLVLTIDPHTHDLEAIFTPPVEAATAIPLLAAAVAGDLPEPAVVVAPDLGAADLAERFGGLLGLPVAVVRKTRLAGDEVRADQVIGEVVGRHPIIVDDMISTGGTIAAAASALQDAGSTGAVTVAATHGVFCGDAAATLDRVQLRRLVVTDTVPLPDDWSLPCDVVGVAPLLAAAIGRLDAHRRLDDLEAFR